MLHVQSSGLDPTVSKLPPVESQYHELAGALDTTRHHMPTKGIYLPTDGKEEYLGETVFCSVSTSDINLFAAATSQPQCLDLTLVDHVLKSLTCHYLSVFSPLMRRGIEH